MSEVAIKVEGLGKRYRIGAHQEAYKTLREKINEAALAPFRAAKHLLTSNGAGQSANGKGQSGNNGSLPLALSSLRPRGSQETFWALRNVSFEIKRGEVVGIIGRNGAGKSTLLKILSRITEPTEGYADINGRIASLLEVGTGFHPELTGRENIFLNGSILGMKRAEINQKFDEIVAFAEIDKFIDTPVKYYSSGMYVRLAFAVAAHLDPDILLVDEVLAVGDFKFQEKCLGKMGEVASEGRTVLFVSHNLSSIQRLCTEAILLEQGMVKSMQKPVEVVRDYMATLQDPPDLRSAGGVSKLRVDARILDQKGAPTNVWPFDGKIIIEVDVLSPGAIMNPAVDVTFYTGTSVRLFTLQSDRLGRVVKDLTGRWRLRLVVDNPGILASEMVVDVGLREGGGAYMELLTNVAMLSTDPNTIPKMALPNCLLYPKVEAEWENCGA